MKIDGMSKKEFIKLHGRAAYDRIAKIVDKSPVPLTRGQAELYARMQDEGETNEVLARARRRRD